MPTYRTNGAWGAGIGVNLTPVQVDNNFYELRTDLDDVIANPPTADGLASVTQSGFYLTFHTTLGNELGPIAIPVVYTVWRGDWAPFTIYSAADIFRVVDEGIFSVLQDHTSAATFDPDAAGGSPLAPYYNELIGVSTLPTSTLLDELSDVTITSVADGDLIAWDTGSSQWTNRTSGDVLALLAPTLDDLMDVIAPSPAVGQILRYLGGSPDKGWQPDTLSLDDLDDVSVAAPSDGDVLTYQAGSPTGWIAEAPAAIPTTLDALTDVIAPSPSDGDLLQFDGADWINASGMSVSGLDDAFLPLVGSDLFEISQSSGSPPGSPPVGYESRKATLADILTAGGFTLGAGPTLALGGATIGSNKLAVAGASLFTGAVTVSGASFGLSGNISAPAWTTSGIRYTNQTGTLTDTTSSGTVATAYSNVFGGSTIAASSATTFTNYINTYVKAPVAGSNVTFTNGYAFGADSALLNAVTLTGNTTLPGSGRISSAGWLGLLGTPGSLLHIQGSVSAAAWTTDGIAIRNNSGTYTDSSSSGTVAEVAVSALGPNALAASSATTYTNASTLKLIKPTAGTNVTLPNAWALNSGNIRVRDGSSGFIRIANNFAAFQLLQDDGNGWRYLLNNDTNFYFQSTTNSFTGATSRLTAFGGGDLRQGTGSAIATTATDGFFLISTCAGAPTGVPTNAGAGQMPMVYDKTNNKFYIYNGAWKGVTLT